MKKNRMMRAASALLVAVLLTTCTISGTFAKYVTSDDASDEARVAKWGVTVSTSGTLFGEKYDKTNLPVTTDTNITVKVGATGTDVVAPGTENTTGMSFGITGTPEVATNISIAVESSDVTLKKTDAVNALLNTPLANDYTPVKFTLSKDGTPVSGYENVTLATIATYLEGLSDTEVPPNTNLATKYGAFNLTWEWDFDNSGTGTYDEADTLLGNIAGNTVTTLANDTDYNLNEAFDITITVTQVD